MPRLAICSVPGCPAIIAAGQGKCIPHRKAADTARGTAAQRGYASRGHKAFRAAVLERDPICVLCRVAVATVADHWPDSRRELVDMGADPNDPSRGRGLCKRCHDRETARNQPGGWAAR